MIRSLPEPSRADRHSATARSLTRGRGSPWSRVGQVWLPIHPPLRNNAFHTAVDSEPFVATVRVDSSVTTLAIGLANSCRTSGVFTRAVREICSETAALPKLNKYTVVRICGRESAAHLQQSGRVSTRCGATACDRRRDKICAKESPKAFGFADLDAAVGRGA